MHAVAHAEKRYVAHVPMRMVTGAVGGSYKLSLTGSGCPGFDHTTGNPPPYLEQVSRPSSLHLHRLASFSHHHRSSVFLWPVCPLLSSQRGFLCCFAFFFFTGSLLFFLSFCSAGHLQLCRRPWCLLLLEYLHNPSTSNSAPNPLPLGSSFPARYILALNAITYRAMHFFPLSICPMPWGEAILTADFPRSKPHHARGLVTNLKDNLQARSSET